MRLRAWSSTSPAALVAAAVLGAAFAAFVSQLWKLELRWFVVIVAGIVLASVSVAFLPRFRDYLLVLLLALFPLAGISKWLGIDWVTDDQRGVALYTGLIGIGPVDLLLAGLAVTWLWEVFVLKTREPPRFRPLDLWIVAILATHLVSIPGTPIPLLSVYAMGYLLKNMFVYFYIANHIDERRLEWVLAAFVGVIALEAALVVLQSQFDILQGLSRDKGSGQAHLIEQYKVPGIEEKIRGEGTAYDSHAMALVFCMLLPSALMLALHDRWPTWRRFVAAGVFSFGLLGLLLTFSRSGWLTFAICQTLLVAMMMVRWRYMRFIPWLFGLALVAMLMAPWALDYFHERFYNTPREVLTSRFDQWEVAWDVWRRNFLFGVGIANYVEVLRYENFNDALELPVHNVVLWLGAETGIFGVVAFFGFIAAVALRFWKLADDPRDLVSVVAAALLSATVAYVVDGLTDPLYREPLVFFMLWMVAGLSVALTEIRRRRLAPPSPATTGTPP